MPQRIVSLLPSATEIVCALGLKDFLVGVSHECDHPGDVVGLPVLTEPKIDPRRPSGEIDRDVRGLVEQGLSVYRIRTDVLRQVRPDLIVTQDQCEVCAVSYREVEQAARACLGSDVTIVSLRPTKLEDILADVGGVATAADRVGQGDTLIARLRERLDAIGARARRVHGRPRVACLEWLEPLMMAGNWIPEMVTLGGGDYPMVQTGAPTPTISWSDLVAYAPDVIVLMPCGFKIEQTRAEIETLTGRPEWQQLPAVRNRRVYLADGNAYLNRPGPRIVESAELLAGLMQPGFFAAGMPPDGWTRL